MASENKPKLKSQPLPGQYEDLDSIPEHLVESVRAIGDAVAAGGLKHVPISSSPETKNSPEDLAKLVDRLQKTFGARGNANAAGSKGNVGPTSQPPKQSQVRAYILKCSRYSFF